MDSDAVVLDVMMPRLGALEALRRIRAFHPEAKVIIVSGNLDEIGAMLSDFLTLKGYSARAVPDAATAVREVVAAPPDVVLLDINMPGLSGTDALPTIRAVAPRES